MTDFPTALYMPSEAGVSMFSNQCLVGGGLTAGNAVWPAANRAIYIPFIVETPVTAYQMLVGVVTQSGNLDVGVYDEYGTRLISKGSTAVAAAGVQRVDITDTPLPPGQYFMAMSCDNATASFSRAITMDVLCFEALGLRQEALGSVTLPNPATFASPAVNYLPALMVSFNATV